MRKSFWLALLALILTITVTNMDKTARANTNPREGDVYQTINTDLTADGTNETLTLTAYNVSEDGYYGQIKVYDAGMNLIWEGPKPTDPFDTMCLGGWNYGTSPIELIADIDGDGFTDLVSACPQSDVRPTTFKMMRWDGYQFVPSFSMALMETAPGSGVFRWCNAPEDYGIIGWVNNLSLDDERNLIGGIISFNPDKTTFGEAVLRPDGDKFVVESWLSHPE